MDALEIAQRYFDAWNRRDADAIMATFAPDGTYSDPTAGSGLTGAAIGAYARGLWQAFPDLAFEVVSAGEAGAGQVAAQWLMKGTNKGPFGGLPPTGRSVSLPGADFIRVEGGTIKSVTGYFDSRVVPDQLGLQIVVQPKEIGPFAFGTSVSVRNGKTNRPGAFSITELRVRSDREVADVQELSRQTATEMLGMKGFLGWVGMTIGNRMMTVTAWENPDDPAQLMGGGAHVAAMKKYYGPDLGAGGMVGVWTPVRLRTTVRCESCGKMMHPEDANGRCRCGAALPAEPPYW